MDKKQEFKLFIQDHPVLVEYIKNNEMTMQKFYELYDIYGPDSDVWNKYFEDRINKDNIISELNNITKNINMEKIHHHINNAQKLIGIIEELTAKPKDDLSIIETPVNNFFGD